MAVLTCVAMPIAELTATPKNELSSTLTPLVAPMVVTELSSVHPENDSSDLNICLSHTRRMRT